MQRWNEHYRRHVVIGFNVNHVELGARETKNKKSKKKETISSSNWGLLHGLLPENVNLNPTQWESWRTSGLITLVASSLNCRAAFAALGNANYRPENEKLSANQERKCNGQLKRRLRRRRKLKSMEIDGFAAQSGLIDSISGPAVIKNVKRVICNYRSRTAMLAHRALPSTQWVLQPQLISFRLNNICAASRGGFSGIALRVTPDKISSKAEILLTNPDRQHPINFSPRSFCASPVGWSANVLN